MSPSASACGIRISSRLSGGGARGGWCRALALTLTLAALAASPQAADLAADADAEIGELARLRPELRERYRHLVKELRCPKCPNQSIEESAATISIDLRRKLRALLEQGLKDEEILMDMASSYGNFVRYRPPFSGAGAWLWLLPPLLLLAAAGVLWRGLRRREAMDTPPSVAAERRHLPSQAGGEGEGKEAHPPLSPPGGDISPRERGERVGAAALLAGLVLALLVGAGVYWRGGAWEQWWLLRQTRLAAQQSVAAPADARLMRRLVDYHRRHPQQFPPGALLAKTPAKLELLIEAYAEAAARHPQDENLQAALVVFRAMRERN